MSTYKIRSAKRSRNERSGIHGWHSYYAGYSEAVVEDLLTYFNANSSSIILDPWLGSGTTAIVCQKKLIPIVGREINPVMTLFSKAKIARLLDFNLIAISRHIVKKSLDIHYEFKKGQVPQGIQVSDYIKLKSIENSFNCVIEDISESEIFKNILSAFYYSAIFQIIRTVGQFAKGSNPTWVINTKVNDHNYDISDLFIATVSAMEDDLSQSYTGIKTYQVPDIKVGDSKSLDISNNIIDYIISSPPYLTRIDYTIATKPELLFLGAETETGSQFEYLRKSTMGAPVIRKEIPNIDNQWGETCTNFLKQVYHHKSKASITYYLKNFIQYFDDAYKSLSEMNRVLKNGGKAAIVVQTSYFKEIQIDLPKIYEEMGKTLGMRSSILSSQIVKQHMAHINTKSSQYASNKTYREEIILLEKEVGYCG